MSIPTEVEHEEPVVVDVADGFEVGSAVLDGRMRGQRHATVMVRVAEKLVNQTL